MSETRDDQVAEFLFDHFDFESAISWRGLVAQIEYDDNSRRIVGRYRRLAKTLITIVEFPDAE